MNPVDFKLISDSLKDVPIRVRTTSPMEQVGLCDIVEVYAPGTLRSCALGLVFAIVRRPLRGRAANCMRVSVIETAATYVAVSVFPDVVRDAEFVAAMQRAQDTRFYMPVFDITDLSDGQHARLLRDVAAVVDAPMFAVLRDR